MSGTKGIEQVAVIAAALVGILDQQADRRAGGPAFIDAGEDLDDVGLLALGDMAGSAGPPAIQLGLDVCL